MHTAQQFNIPAASEVGEERSTNRTGRVADKGVSLATKVPTYLVQEYTDTRITAL
jgi:hypothetical protein